METSTLLQIAIATTVCGLVLGLITFYLSIWIDKSKILKKNNINWNDNLFYPIYVSGKILGCSILVAQLIPAISTTIKIVLRKANENYFLEIDRKSTRLNSSH